MTRLQLTLPDHVHYSTEQSVRVQDINYRRHLAHDKIISMIHDARAAFFEHLEVSELEDSPVSSNIS